MKRRVTTITCNCATMSSGMAVGWRASILTIPCMNLLSLRPCSHSRVLPYKPILGTIPRNDTDHTQDLWDIANLRITFRLTWVFNQILILNSIKLNVCVSISVHLNQNFSSNILKYIHIRENSSFVIFVLSLLSKLICSQISAKWMRLKVKCELFNFKTWSILYI